jgi:hypothetical protein
LLLRDSRQGETVCVKKRQKCAQNARRNSRSLSLARTRAGKMVANITARFAEESLKRSTEKITRKR